MGAIGNSFGGGTELAQLARPRGLGRSLVNYKRVRVKHWLPRAFARTG
jgi:hypothetical protein